MSKSNGSATAGKAEAKKMKCGIIMPISNHPDYPVGHWADVLSILIEAVGETDFEANLVSEDVAVGLIHERIVTNIYFNEMVICDVSSKNPNVMFELGLRLAFDKPTIIIVDEKTGYSFDTGVIEHIKYPSTLRFNEIVKFKETLVTRINATYEKSKEKGFSPFLKSFTKEIVASEVGQISVSENEFLMSKLDKLDQAIASLQRTQVRRVNTSTSILPLLYKKDELTWLEDRNMFAKSEVLKALDSLKLDSQHLGKLTLEQQAYIYENIRQRIGARSFDEIKEEISALL